VLERKIGHSSPRRLLEAAEKVYVDSSFDSMDSCFVTEGRESKVVIHAIISTIGHIEQRTRVRDRVLLLPGMSIETDDQRGKCVVEITRLVFSSEKIKLLISDSQVIWFPSTRVTPRQTVSVL
jgi:nitrate reductase NapAB chaperone NapD